MKIVDNEMSTSYSLDVVTEFDSSKSNAYEEWIRDNVKDKTICIINPNSFLQTFLCLAYGGNVIQYSTKSNFYKNAYTDLPYEHIIGNFEFDDLPEADYYIHDMFSSNLVGEVLFLYKRMRYEGLLSKVIPTRIAVYDCVIGKTETKSIPLDWSSFDVETKKYFDVAKVKEKVGNFKYNIVQNEFESFNKIYEGDMANFTVDMLIRPELNNLAWSISFGKNSTNSFNNYGKGYYRIAKWLDKEPFLNLDVEEAISLKRA